MKSTILIIEDNDLNRDMLSRRLQHQGFTVLVAVNGKEGIQIAKNHHADLILMDMSLPIIDGWEAARRLKSDTKTQSTPIIALTAHAMTGDREKALAAGCDDYDIKPIELPRLLSKINALLKNPSSSLPERRGGLAEEDRAYDEKTNNA